MYLLDTDIIIYSLKAHQKVRKNLERHLNTSMKISTVTLMELYYGAYKSQKVAGNLAKIKIIENAMDIVPVTRDMVEIFGILKSDLEKEGKPLDDFDLILASTAMANNLTIVTNNEKHFGRIQDLRMENWTRI